MMILARIFFQQILDVLKENMYLLVPMYEEALEKLGNTVI